jgi:hypothetical protein
MKLRTYRHKNTNMKTQIVLPKITFNYKFKNKKEARQEAIRVLMSCIDDKSILKDIKVIIK